MAPKAKKSTKKRSAGGKKGSVSIEMVRGAVAALGDRNGSTINAIFNYLVRTKKVTLSSRTLVILAIGRACRDGSMKKNGSKTFVLASGKRKAASPKRRKGKRKGKKRGKKTSAKRKSKKRRQRKRRSLKKKTKRRTKRRGKKAGRKSAAKKSRKARRSRKPTKKTYKKPMAKGVRSRPARRAARRINYRE